MSGVKQKDTAETTSNAPEDDAGRKGHATPKRKEAQQARQRPLVVADRKAAKKAERAKRDELYAKQNEAMTTGDPRLEKYLPQRDRGPVRRFARDYVDARWCLGELFLPLAFVILILMMFSSSYPVVAFWATVGMYAVVFGGLIDSTVMVYFLRRRLKESFTADQIPGWTGMYAFQRSFMLRRFRMPRPRVERGQWPHRTKD